MTNNHTSHGLFDKIELLAPLIREHADRAEREQRLPETVAKALRDAGFFRMLRPRSRGGWELDPVSEFRIAEGLARIDSAAAWNVQVCNASELYGGWFADDASQEIWGDPNAIVAGAFNPHRRAIAVDGGFRLSGRTTFNSNCHNATWIIGLAQVFDGDQPRLGPDGAPDIRLTAVPAADVAIVENWNTMGMRGTGSHDVSIDDVFVPDARAVSFAPLERPAPAYDGPLSRMVVWATVGCHAAVALGVAQAAIDDLVTLGAKVPAYTEKSLADRTSVQSRLAQAAGKLGAARSFFHSVFDEAWHTAAAGNEFTMELKARCQLAGTTAASSAADVVDLVHACAGTSGIREEQSFEKHFRDAHVITQHAFLSEARLEAVGQIILGREPDWAFFSF